MAQPNVSNLLQKILVDTVGSVTITDIALDSTGKAIREVRVFGVADADNATAPLVFTLRLSAALPAAIKIATPAATF